MSKGIEIQILSKIKKAKRGSLFFMDSFATTGNAKTVNKALQRLVKSGEIERLATGIYYRPETSDLIGKLTPSIEAVAVAIAKQDRAKIFPTGAYAENRLGLSTQVPMNVVYVTDGSARKIKIGKRSILFKKVNPKSVAMIGEISGLAIQALKSIGKEKVRDTEIKHIQKLLKNKKPTRLEHDIRLAPAWIRKIFLPVLIELKNEQK
ncbi:MAG: DUF6088 family protein [Chitinophagaceae bacterium]